MQKAVAKKQTGISQQEERIEEAPAREDTEGASVVKSTGKTPLKEITVKTPQRESEHAKSTCEKTNGDIPARRAHAISTSQRAHGGRLRD